MRLDSVVGKNNMKIQLIKAPTRNTGMPEHDWYTPLNLIWLANYLKPYPLDVEILDGQMLSLEEIISRISGDIVAVSFDILSIFSFDRIVCEAKAKGALTLAGGHLATAIGTILLQNNPDLDVVVRYDGEEALLGIVLAMERTGELGDDIPNILFRRRGEIINTVNREINLSILPIPEREVGGINLQAYYRNFQTSKSKLKLPFTYNNPTNTYSHKGCPFRTSGNGCSFCSRVDQRFRQKPAEKVYDEYFYLTKKCGVDYISDFSDSWIITPFLKGLHQEYQKRGIIPARLRVYGDVRLVTPENAMIMRQLGVDTVLLGIESGNEEILRLNGKPTRKEQILTAVKILADNGIKIADAYVLGLIGETKKTVEDTVRLFRDISKICETEISYWNIMTPLPGSLVWNRLLEMGFLDIKGYYIDTEVVERTAIQALCNLDNDGYDWLIDVREEMLSEASIASAEFIPNLKVIKESAI